MPLVTRFSNLGLSGLGSYNEVSSNNSELRRPPRMTLKYSRDHSSKLQGKQSRTRKAGKKRR